VKFKYLNTSEKLQFYAIEEASFDDVPLYGDSVPAGFPSPADDYLDMDLNLHDYLVQHPSATFCVRAIGDSMVDAGIQSSDVMVVDRALTPKNNDIILAVVNGEFTVKRIKKSEDELYLMPANENYKPMKITEEMNFQVWGVVTFIIHKANASTSGL
jgi:DNA polymerase V